MRFFPYEVPLPPVVARHQFDFWYHEEPEDRPMRHSLNMVTRDSVPFGEGAPDWVGFEYYLLGKWLTDNIGPHGEAWHMDTTFKYAVAFPDKQTAMMVKLMYSPEEWHVVSGL